jgi:hypothetical protein
VFRLLESNAHPTQRELSKGLIKIGNFKNNKNKWVYAYLLTPKCIAEKTALTSAFLKRKMKEY